jgi:hypothetical protein
MIGDPLQERAALLPYRSPTIAPYDAYLADRIDRIARAG